jgi:hypothetical protein
MEMDRDAKDACTLRDELRPFLDTIRDHGSGMDSGGGAGGADLWLWVGGVEYVITIKPTGNVRASEPLPEPPSPSVE